MKSKFIVAASMTLVLSGISLEARVSINVSGRPAPSEEQPTGRWHSERAREHKMEAIGEDKPTPPSPPAPGTPVSPRPLPPAAPSATSAPQGTATGASSTQPGDRRVIVRSWERELYLKQQSEKEEKGDNVESDEAETPRPSSNTEKTAPKKTTGQTAEQPSAEDTAAPAARSSFFSPARQAPTIVNHPHRRF